MSKICFVQNGVRFHLERGKNITGTFQLVFRNGEFIFEWFLKEPLQFLGTKFVGKDCHFAWRLCEVVQIIKLNRGFSKTTLQFVLEDSTKIPFFTFYSPHSDVMISHMIEFLIKKGYASETGQSNSYYVNLQYQPLAAPPKYITPQNMIYLANHIKIIKSLILKEKEIQITPISSKDIFNYPTIDVLRDNIAMRGVDDEGRPLAWLYLLNIYDPSKSMTENQNSLSNMQYRYKMLYDTWNSIPDIQKEESFPCQKLEMDIWKDVKRTDRGTAMFKGDDNPNLQFLFNVTMAHATYSRDTGFVQGMCDIIAIIMAIYIKSWKDGKIEFFDGRLLSTMEAESIIFEIFEAFMSITQHERLFTDLQKMQQFQCERIFAIIAETHQPMADWLQDTNAESLIFFYRPMILLFKREFDRPVLLRLWDAFLSDRHPQNLVRFFSAVVLILGFPSLAIGTNGSLEEIVRMTDEFVAAIDTDLALTVARRVEMDFETRKDLDWVLEPLPDSADFREYSPKYMKINSSQI